MCSSLNKLSESDGKLELWKTEITTTLGRLVIINSLYKGIQWYNGNITNDVATAIYTKAIGEIIAINKRP